MFLLFQYNASIGLWTYLEEFLYSTRSAYTINYETVVETCGHENVLCPKILFDCIYLGREMRTGPARPSTESGFNIMLAYHGTEHNYTE